MVLMVHYDRPRNRPFHGLYRRLLSFRQIPPSLWSIQESSALGVSLGGLEFTPLQESTLGRTVCTAECTFSFPLIDSTTTLTMAVLLIFASVMGNTG